MIFNQMVATTFLFLAGLFGAISGLSPAPLESARRAMASADPCVHAILHCASHYTPITADPFGGVLYETTQELDKACRGNVGFVECVKEATELCEKRSVETTMIQNRLWVTELCAPISKWKTWYLTYAPCLNQELPEATKTCQLQHTPPTADLAEMCRYLDDLMDCKLNIIENKCGDIAADIHTRIIALNGGREYVCSKLHQPITDEDSAVLIAAKLLNNVKNLLRNISYIIGDSKITEDNILGWMDPIHSELNVPFSMNVEEFKKMPDGSILENVADTERDKKDTSKKMPFDFAEISDLLTEDDSDFVGNFLDHLEMQSSKKNSVINIDVHTKEYFNDNVLKTPSDLSEDFYSEINNKVENQFSHKQVESCETYDGSIRPHSEKSAFLTVFEISDIGHKIYFGSGHAKIEWNMFQNASLGNFFCNFIYPLSSSGLFRCAVKLTELKFVEEDQTLYTPPVLLSLYAIHGASKESGEVTLTEMPTICVENYQSYVGPSIESEELYSPQSEFKNYMHDQDIHRMGELWNHEDSDCADDSSESCSSSRNPDVSTMEEDEDAFLDESEEQFDEPIDTNISYISSDPYEMTDESDSDGKLASLHDSNMPKRPRFTNRYLASTTSDEVSEDELPVFVNYEPESCPSKANSDCPKTNPEVKPVRTGSSENLKHGSELRPGRYSHAREMETVDPLEGSAKRDHESPPRDVDYVAVGSPFDPDYKDSTDAFYKSISKLKTMPEAVIPSEAVKFIRDEIENLNEDIE